MAGDAPPISYVTYADFVALEEKATTRHEWLDGMVRELGEEPPNHWPTARHSWMKNTLIDKLRTLFNDERCRVFDTEVEIRVIATGFITRPDASIVYGSLEMDPNNRNAVTNPRVIVEVLSDSTEAYDRGEKFAHYRRIPSLMEYVLVSQKEPRIEVWRRNASDKWELAEEALAGQTATLASIECELSVDDVYADPLAAEN